MLIQTDKMPTTGQFVAMWVYNGKLWSGTFMWDGGEHPSYYNPLTGGYRDDHCVMNFDPEDGIKPVFYQHITPEAE